MNQLPPFSDLTSILPEATLVLDEDVVIYANPAAAVLLEKPVSEIRGKKLDFEPRPGEVEIRPGLFTEMITSTIRITGMDWGTSVDIRITEGNEKAPGGWGTSQRLGQLVIIKDITARKEMEKELASRIAELERQKYESNELSEMVNLLQSCEDLSEACIAVSDYGKRLFESAGSLYIAGKEGLEVGATWCEYSGEPSYPEGDCWALRTGKTHVSLQESKLLCKHIPSGQNGVCVPMQAQGDVIGVLTLLDANQTARLTKFAETLKLALANINLKMKLRELSSTDPLTGLRNRRSFEEQAERVLKHAKRNEKKLAIIFFDVDHFKTYNDSFGHEAGDRALISLGAHLLRSFRSGDLTCRFGGEEFVILLSDANQEVAMTRAEKLRNEAEKMLSENPITISIGVSFYPENGSSLEELIKNADDAMYRSKNNGRNQVQEAKK